MSDFDARAKNWDANPQKTERAETVAAAIRAAVPLSPSMTALEYGCGTGLLSFALQPELGKIVLADSSQGMLAELRRKLDASGIANMHPLHLDLAVDPPPAERFDLIYSLMTLHHIPDTAGILRQFHALLKRPGFLCIADLDREDGSFHGEGFDGHHGFDRDELAALAKNAGFSDVEFVTAFHMPKTIAGEQRLFPVFLMTARAGAL
ncbi:MAG TPA: class I SAM-dependent methyltransferase [Desulfuromonadales bacterium]|nr:class I SAM-dependent methyltransferase [Desulfuromonadales bacterium]